MSELARMDNLVERLTAEGGSTVWNVQGLSARALWEQVRQEADRFLHAEGETERTLPLA
ncbi:hypothetical protein [Streptomyces sp. NPDC058157]|uniref:hypothetical protein n=1 Tax=Streptomyces sp. NPDC058157 TaxID=3346360 RepID=UPI0036EB0717